MTYIERKNYVFYSSIALIPGALAFGILPLIAMLITDSANGPFHSIPLDALFFALLGGIMTLSIVSGIMLFAKFVSSKGKNVKVIMIIFLFISIYIYYFFFVISVPYYIYSLVKIQNRRYVKEM